MVVSDLCAYIANIILEEIESQGIRYGLNQEFINEACALSDELSIDELVAAELILNGAGDSTRLSLNNFQGGIAVFHVRREYILDLTRFFLNSHGHGDLLDAKFETFVKMITNNKNPSLLTRTLKGMKDIEDLLLKLHEKEARATFLGQTESQEFIETLKLRRDFLLNEHDTLGQILHSVIENDHIQFGTDVTKLFTQVQSIDSYDTILMHYIPAIIQVGLRLDPFHSPNPLPLSLKEAVSVKSILGNQKAWKLQPWRGTVQFIFYTYVAGLHRAKALEGESLENIQLKSDIMDPVREAIDSGAIELLLFIASDINPCQTDFQPFYDYRPELQFYVQPYESLGAISENLSGQIIASLERLVEAVISNLADILREMRLNEEDMYLTNSASQDNGLSQPIGLDLERFFIFVSCLYHDRPDAAINYWSDTESDLYGFVLWSSQCDIVYMTSAFCNMFSSLATGPTCALSAHKFLSMSTTSASFASRNRKIAHISWSHVFATIKDQISKLKPPQPPPSSLLSKAKVIANIPEMDSSDIVMLTNYLSIISQVVIHSSEAREELLASAEYQLNATLFEFLLFYTPLYGPILNVLSGLSLSPQYKDQIWLSLDQLLFNSIITFPQNEYLVAGVSPKERLVRLLDSYGSVLGFSQLLESLLRIPGEQPDLYSLPYPENLGEKYRNPGIWPYVDYMINEVFCNASSAEAMGKDSQITLQSISLKFIRHCLELFDSEIAVISASKGVNLDLIVKAPSFLSYLLAHPITPAMNYLFDSKIYNPLIQLASIGIDVISELPESSPIPEMLIDSLKTINDIFDLQSTFTDVIIKHARKSGDPSLHLSTHGLSTFEDAILYNIPVISHLALYVGSTNIELAQLALQLLNRISNSSQFSAPSYSAIDSRVKSNRLLSILETVDESTRIKVAFIEQLERSNQDIYDPEIKRKSMELKEDIIGLITDNLSLGPKAPTIAHFLLGFKMKTDGFLELDEATGGIKSDISLLASIMNISINGILQITPSNVPKLSAVISSSCTKVVQLLLRNPITSSKVIDYFRETEFFMIFLNAEPTIDLKALWEGRPFQSEDEFFLSDSATTLEAFLKQRAAFLRCLSIEVHTAANNGALSLVSRYKESLVNMDMKKANSFVSSSATRILSFLDVLEFQIPTSPPEDAYILENFGYQIHAQLFKKDADLGIEALVAETKLMIRLKGLEFVARGSIESLEDPEFLRGANFVVEEFTRRKVYERLRTSQLECLNSWSKLVLVLVLDADMTIDARTTFLVATFQSIVPRLAEYSILDVTYAESIASLLVLLFTIYQNDMASLAQSSDASEGVIEHQKGSYDRTLSLFKAAISSVLTTSSTSTLRSELYVIAFKYLHWVLGGESNSNQTPSPQIRSCMQIVRTSGDRFIETVCNDAINGEGNTRLTALMLLNAVCSLSTRAHSRFFLDTLVKYNHLLLVVQSITRFDKDLVTREKSSSVKMYQLQATFKAVLGFLLQVARTRPGAHQIIQCGLFNILKSCEFLRIDPDVGIELPLISDTSNNGGGGGVGGGGSVGAVGSDALAVIAGSKNSGNGEVNIHQPTDTQSTFYGLVSPIFQLVTAVLLSMGAENEPVITRVRSFLHEHELLLAALLRKDVLTSDHHHPKLTLLVKHIVLLISLTDNVN